MDQRMLGLTSVMRSALDLISKGGCTRYVGGRHFWSLHGNPDLRSIRGLIKRDLVRVRQTPIPATRSHTAPLIEQAYLTESGRYVLDRPDLDARVGPMSRSELAEQQA